MYALDFDKERRKKSYTGRHSHTNLFEYDCKIPILDDDNNDAHHFHGMPYRKQLFENIWRADIVDRKTWFTIKKIFVRLFFTFVTFQIVYSRRVFFFSCHFWIYWVFFFLTNKQKLWSLLLCLYFFFSLSLLFGVNMKIQCTFNRRAVVVHFLCFGLEKKSEVQEPE